MTRQTVDRVFFAFGCLFGFLGVALGAFGAHALRLRLSPEMLAVFETGVRYQFVHALALLAVAWACTRWPGRAVRAAGWLFVTGVVLFCGSLYALALSGLRAIGVLTPCGGLALLAAWLCLGWAAWRAGRPSKPGEPG
jgi:uncharacterized membrane protein YgdD (TMEM256/DUF423 family)